MRFEGKLYYDNSNETTFEHKVKVYADQYKRWTKKTAKICRIHPNMTELEEVGGIKIEKTIAINPNYFWIGEEIEDN